MKYFKHNFFNGSMILSAFLIVFALCGLKAQTAKPNIVLIMADDMGFECLQANGGSSYSTPNLNLLSAKGVRFVNYHSQPVCTPTRVQLLTGQYNVRNYLNFGIIKRDQITFASLLKEAGYKTAIAGKWQLGIETDSAQHFGFEQSCIWDQSFGSKDDQGRDTRYVNPVFQINGILKNDNAGKFGPDMFTDFLCDFMEENKNQPFLAYYPMVLTHAPFSPTPDSEDWDPLSKGSLVDIGDKKHFPDMVAYADKMVGKIVNKIESLGIAENTIIIFTTDNGTTTNIVSTINGANFKGGKGLTLDSGTHTPLIVRWDNKIAPARVSRNLVDCSDFFPTFCELAQKPIPSSLVIDGKSILPHLLDIGKPTKDWIYSWYSKSGRIIDLKEWVRNDTYKLYKNGDFFNVQNDSQEKSSIPFEGLTANEKLIYNTFIKALENYENIR